MQSINIRDLFSKVICKYIPSDHIQKIFQINISGSGDAFDYIKVLEKDEELIEFLKSAANNLTNTNIKHFDHALAILGLNNVKSCLLGIELAKMLNPNLKQLPLFKDALAYTKHASIAEEKAKKIDSNYTEIAYSCGFIFDIFQKKFLNIEIKDIENAELKNPELIIEDVFSNAILTAITAEIFSKNFKITYKKYIFAAGLLHNIGKLLIFAYSPKIFDQILSTAKSNNVYFHQAEAESIDTLHNTLGSLYIRQLSFIKAIEKYLDYHHDPSMLKHSDIPLYELSCVLYIASLVVKHNKSKIPTKDFPTDTIEEELLFLNYPKEKIYEFVELAKNFKNI